MRFMTAMMAAVVLGGALAAAPILVGEGNLPATTAPATRPSATAPSTDDYMSTPTKGAGPVWMKHHEEFLARIKQGPIGVLFLGDSITALWQGSGQNIWKKRYEPLPAAQFGIGSERTEYLLWRITNGELDNISPKVVVVLIGINDIWGDAKTPEKQVEQMHSSMENAIKKIVVTTREKLPRTKVLLMGIFPVSRPDPETAKFRCESLQKINAELAKLDDGKNVRFLDLTENFAPGGKLNADFFADGVHLSEKGYEVWADRMDPLLKEMMK